MLQPPTIERQDRHATEQEIRAQFGVRGLRLLTEFEHITTHRRVRFEVWQAAGATREARLPGRFMDPAEVAAAPLASPHRRILLAMVTTQRARPVSARL
jgi:adenine-specific DNA glycosylase